MRWPVSAQTYEDVSSVIVRLDIAERPEWTPTVVDRETIPGPDYPVGYSAAAVAIDVLIAMGALYRAAAVLVSGRTLSLVSALSATP